MVLWLNHSIKFPREKMEKSFFLWITYFGSLLTVSDSYLTAGAKNSFVPENHKNWKNLDHRTCGFSWKHRIIGGKEAPLGKYPWLVRIGTIREGHSPGYKLLMFVCGGSILNRYFVITAAHCFLDPRHIPNIVRAGEHDMSKEIDCEGSWCAEPAQDIRIQRYYTPVYFQSESMENDLVLIELAHPVTFSETVLPICLPPYSISSKPLTNKMTEVAGWGLIDIHSKKTPQVLHAVKLRIVENRWCQTYRERHYLFPFNIICAGGIVGQDSCSGDSGGPLMLPVSTGGTNKYYVVGIVSYGPEACGATTSPGVYTYVPQYLNWILNIIDKK